MREAKCVSTARLDGKTAVVTGSNSGIGKWTVRDFYLRGARVIMACRNINKANEAADEIRESCKNQENVGEIVITELDLSSLESIKKCAQHLLDTENRIDLLINNAGVMMTPESSNRTVDGFEMQFGTNHLGHFLLTLLLLPKICRSTPARIVIVSSDLHQGRIDFADPNWNQRKYSPMKGYQQSKLANILFCKELARKLEENNIEGVNIYCLHPGVIKTEIQRNFDDTLPWGVGCFFKHVVVPFLKTPEEGAQTTIYCAVDEKCANETGLYYADCRPKQPSKEARNEEEAKKLWDLSLELVGLENNYNPFKL